MEPVPHSDRRIRVGVAGWDYADWQGPVYPGGTARADRLAFLSRYVDVIEINSTFYRPVAPRTAAAWVRRTAARTQFAFTAKTHRSWSHERDAADAAQIAATLEGLLPLREAGRLRALLLQFPQSFHYGPSAAAWLERMVERSTGWPLVVEVRHASWQTERATRWFATLGVGWCVVDQPRVGHSTAGARARVVGRLGYLRLHGRNAADWFRADAGRDARYDYLYAPDELEQLAGTARSMAQTAEELIVVQNNHFRGQALVNALQMKRLLQGRAPLAPQTLLAAYPQLRGEVRAEQERLF